MNAVGLTAPDMCISVFLSVHAGDQRWPMQFLGNIIIFTIKKTLHWNQKICNIVMQ